jgi:hypothetical protein
MKHPDLDPAVWQRVMTAAEFQEPDRVPIWDFLDNRGVLEHFAPGESDLLAANVKAYHSLGIDMCRGFGSSFAVAQEGTLNVGEDGQPRSRISGQTQWNVRRAIRSLEDLKKYEPSPASREWVYESFLPGQRRMQEAFVPHTMYIPGHGCGFHAAYDLMGIELFSYAVYDAFADLQRILDAHMQTCAMVAEAAAREKVCPFFFIGDDIAYKDKLMFSPALLRRTFIPMLAVMCKALNQAGIKVIFHSDGYLMPIIDDLIEAGVSGINPIEPIAGMDLAVLKRCYHGRLIMVGGVDCSQLLPLGSVQDVERATIQALRTAGPGGGYFIGSSSEITPSTPVENVIAFCRTVHQHGRYPIR